MDLSGASGTLTSKGSSKREKMQQDLANRSSNYFLQVSENGFRRLHPAASVPQSLEDMRSDSRLSFVTYLGRFGGFNQARELGLVMHQLAFIAACCKTTLLVLGST